MPRPPMSPPAQVPAIDAAPRRREVVDGGQAPAGRLRVREGSIHAPQAVSAMEEEAPGATVMVLELQDGSNLRTREISQLAEGGNHCFRSSRVLREGQLVGRPPLGEQRVEATAARSPSRERHG